MDNDNKSNLRLQVFMAHSGVASRRKCEFLISEGYVKVNGSVVTEMGVRVNADDTVTYKGRVLNIINKKLYIALNKPPLYLCSNSDPQGRSLAIDLIKNDFSDRLYNVGRLDYLSTGLIFFTNDGNFTKIVAHPSSGIEKEYVVETKQAIDEQILLDFMKGVTIEGEKYKLHSYKYKTKFKVKLILLEGKNREIRRFFQSRNMKIRKLHRVRIGIVQIENIPSGSYRYLTKKEVSWFINKKRRQNKDDNCN
ncbi:MAG: rRNA pseudouridine synthase [Spirochaetales bacterium]|nr:rRNA pseudouridine synthase [Spirochaetales bacterium]